MQPKRPANQRKGTLHSLARLDDDDNIYIYIYISKVGDCSRRQLKRSLFLFQTTQKLPFPTRGVGEGATPFPGLLHFTLDMYLIMLIVKQDGIKYHFFKSLVWRDLGLNLSVLSHWRTFYPLGQWAGYIVWLKYFLINTSFYHQHHDVFRHYHSFTFK